MDQDDARLFIEELFEHVMRRKPRPEELRDWAGRAALADRPQDLFRALIRSRDYLRRRHVATQFPAGHFHSPVVDPASVADYYNQSLHLQASDLPGIAIDEAAMLAFWDRSLPVIATTPFRMEKTPEHRFHYEGGPFPWGDAIMLRAMIAQYRPRRIIEIGSGFSTACMLDSADGCSHPDIAITCIEPYPDRLHSLLRPEDYARVTVMPLPVQSVSLEHFDVLERNDILFIDSTHVLKTGSDVHYELFSILPRLRPGVLIHVHDCPFPFEYPARWVLERNYSWNEVYALRAFLMYNDRFSILFWNSYLARTNRAKLQGEYPDFLRNPGSSIWLETTGSGGPSQSIIRPKWGHPSD